jgi:hypothetical protein
MVLFNKVSVDSKKSDNFFLYIAYRLKKTLGRIVKFNTIIRTKGSNANFKYRMHSESLHGYLNKKGIRASLERLKIVQDGGVMNILKGLIICCKMHQLRKVFMQCLQKTIFQGSLSL